MWANKATFCQLFPASSIVLTSHSLPKTGKTTAEDFQLAQPDTVCASASRDNSLKFRLFINDIGEDGI